MNAPHRNLINIVVFCDLVLDAIPTSSTRNPPAPSQIRGRLTCAFEFIQASKFYPDNKTSSILLLQSLSILHSAHTTHRPVDQSPYPLTRFHIRKSSNTGCLGASAIYASSEESTLTSK